MAQKFERNCWKEEFQHEREGKRDSDGSTVQMYYVYA